MQAAKGSKDAFLVREWLAADADARTADDTTLGEGVSCDDNGCVTASPSGALVAWAQRPEALADDCERAALIVALRQPPAACAASVIDTERLRRQGALALRRGRDGFVVDAVKPASVDRPWSKAIAEDGETDSAVLAPRKPSPRAVDATPSDADLQAEE
jgi:competence protein ComEC